MNGPVMTPATADVEIDLSQFDFSSLVGREIVLFSEQFPGRPLPSRVTSTLDGALTIDKSGSNGTIDSLVHNQPVTIQIDYKGQKIAVQTLLKRGAGGKCTLLLGEKVKPISRRRFCRIPCEVQVKLAILPSSGLEGTSIAKLRWLETTSLNFSAGGLMLRLHAGLDSRSHLIMNVVPPQMSFPALVIARARHSHSADVNVYHVGIEFLTKESLGETMTPHALRGIPSSVTDYTAVARIRLNKVVEELKKKRSTM
jgi:c-di-GMP-binding flagellar brake protein YcgR